MKVLLDGSLNQSLQLKDLLSGISQAEAPGLTVLKFVASKEEQGELYFLGGHFIVCARLSTSAITGMAALDELLKLKQANFVYYACDSVDALPQSDNLKIDLKELIDKWQEAKPISEDQLLDKIFNVTTTDDNTQAHPQFSQKEVPAESMNEEAVAGIESTADSGINAVKQSAQPAESAAWTGVTLAPRDDMKWDLVEPLVSSGAPGSGTDGSDWTPGEEVHDASDLRSMLGGWQWQRKLRKLFLLMIIFLVVSIIIIGCIWLLMNAPSAHLGPRRYAVPIEKRNFHRYP
jgi:hypothetical protein